VCLTVRVDGKYFYIVDMFRKKIDYPEQRKMYSELARRHGARTVLVERAANGFALISDLRQLNTVGVPAPTGITPKGDKRARVSLYSAKLERGEVLIPHEAPWLEDFLAEVLGFPGARHDDIVDALMQILHWDLFLRNNDGGVGFGEIILPRF
jgi:predicted phage terminase large subunit-like protein